SLRPSPVIVLTPVLGDAATTSWPPRRRMTAVLEPIRPVPPMMSIFMVQPFLSVRCEGASRYPEMGQPMIGVGDFLRWVSGRVPLANSSAAGPCGPFHAYFQVARKAGAGPTAHTVHTST